MLCILRGPGGFLGGHVTDSLVAQVDLYPTLCELAGAPLPDGLHGDLAAAAGRATGGRRSATSCSPS